MRKLIALAIALTASAAFAEIKLPEASPNSVITQEIGISKVTIDYHRPAVKGRKVWGDLVPTGKVWRLGANNATTLELSHNAKINGHDVPAGKYALFAIPKDDSWTMIVNKKNEQWGAYFYKAEDDVVRFNAKPEKLATPAEWFDIDTVPLSDRAIRVEISWENVRVPFTIEFDTAGLVWKQIDEKLASPNATWDEYLTAARYAMNTNTRFEEGLTWVDEAMRRKESFWNYELKGLMLHKLGRDEEAAPLMYKAAELAKGKAPQEYVDNVLKEVASWKK